MLESFSLDEEYTIFELGWDEERGGFDAMLAQVQQDTEGLTSTDNHITAYVRRRMSVQVAESVSWGVRYSHRRADCLPSIRGRHGR